MSDTLDFHLDDFEPADAESQATEQRIWPGDLTVLGEHHTRPYGSHSFVVAHDRSVTWGVPGAPQLVAIAVARDLNHKTFTYQAAYHPTLAFAQNWLIERGCPQEQIGQLCEGFMTPADELSSRIEQKIRESGGRYEVLDSFTSDFDPAETWTLVRDGHAEQAPVRVFLETGNFDSQTYTVREGAFLDEKAARGWLDERDAPLPEPPEYRSEAAALRSPVATGRTSTGALPAATGQAAASAVLPLSAPHATRGAK
ncbi:glycosyl hydrolase [Streptantibioticus parmotrematis]|uniref:glycosyl hydrolase n=1 Tax=Streptantibioticus parmotrematis TaxID=2873249 RepID=UPI0034082270